MLILLLSLQRCFCVRFQISKVAKANDNSDGFVGYEQGKANPSEVFALKQQAFALAMEVA